MPTPWEEQEIGRIQNLSDEQLMREVHDIMTGYRYSWNGINKRLREMEIIDYSICREWKFICQRKREWDQCTRRIKNIEDNSFDAAVVLAQLTQNNLWSAKAYRHFLIKLKVLPTLAGLGADGIPLVNANLDRECLVHSSDLWIEDADREWKAENLTDEEEPLLGGRSRGGSCQTFWGRWRSILRSL